MNDLELLKQALNNHHLSANELVRLRELLHQINLNLMNYDK